MTITVRVQAADFDMAEEYQMLSRSPAHGALVTFCGLVRDLPSGALHGLTLEHYPGMTEQALTDIARKAQTRWPVGAITIIHRIGRLAVNDQIVFVGVASAHRKAAFSCAEFIMDFLKTSAPFWKKEHLETGAYWVEAKESDVQATARWNQHRSDDLQPGTTCTDTDLR